MVAAGSVLLAAGSIAHGRGAKLESLQTPRGAKQAFVLIRPFGPPTAWAVLFAGGHGALGLTSASSMNWGTGNFLVRSRMMFASRRLGVAVVDAPSDHRDGMNADFRMGRAHASDIAAVAAYLKKDADIPVWLIGTSMGTFSAAGGAIGSAGVDGLVLTSTITRARPDWKIAATHRDGVASMALDRVTVPTLIVSHRNDGCKLTPSADAAKLRDRLVKARKAEVVLLDGGLPPVSEPCESKSQHGFFGIERQAVDAIAAFIKANPK